MSFVDRGYLLCKALKPSPSLSTNSFTVFHFVFSNLSAPLDPPLFLHRPVRRVRFWEARSVRCGGDLMGVDMLLLDSQAVPEKCKYEVISTKIEIRLAKAEIVTWASLEHDKGPTVLPKPNVSTEVSMRLAYPSSKRVKDWDKLEAEVKKQEKDEKLEC
ncbi:hypothetical protein Bca52824_057159 [Brassica carinata]|uniref:CS domain-containing protein n=1 Tax=Brassica carinata TaxID=52824 RepID=A0A8X7UDJ6_BRACI|nr:hypothetical protein Bca52824_057159 [Brassica carinata]